MKLKKRTFLILMVALTATFASAQKQSQPEWQSQYAVGRVSLLYEPERKVEIPLGKESG